MFSFQVLLFILTTAPLKLWYEGLVSGCCDWEVNMWMWGNPRTCFLLERDKRQLESSDRAERHGSLSTFRKQWGNKELPNNYPTSTVMLIKGPQVATLPVVLIVIINRRQEKQTLGQTGIFISTMTSTTVDSQGYIFPKNMLAWLRNKPQDVLGFWSHDTVNHRLWCVNYTKFNVCTNYDLTVYIYIYRPIF